MDRVARRQGLRGLGKGCGGGGAGGGEADPASPVFARSEPRLITAARVR